MLTSKLSSEFDHGTREKGWSYFKSGAVKLRGINTIGQISADVRGTSRYRVNIEVEQEPNVWTFIASCDCPYARQVRDCCKHMWATLAAVERSNIINQLGRLPRQCYLDPIEPDYFEDDVDGPFDIIQPGPYGISNGRSRKKAPPQRASWKKFFDSIGTTSSRSDLSEPNLGRIDLLPLYVLELDETKGQHKLVITFGQQNFKKNGELGKLKSLSIQATDILKMPDPIDRMICLMLFGAPISQQSYGYYNSYSSRSRWEIPNSLSNEILPHLFASGRFIGRAAENEEARPLSWDGAGRWELKLRFESSATRGSYDLTSSVRRGDQQRALSPTCVCVYGRPALFIENGVISEVEIHDSFEWLEALSAHQRIPVGQKDIPGVLKSLQRVSSIPAIEWPADWGVSEVRDIAPKPELVLRVPEKGGYPPNAAGQLFFHYDKVKFDWADKRRVSADIDSRQIVHRNPQGERTLIQRLFELGAKKNYYENGFELTPRQLPSVVATLLSEGWDVVGNQKLYRRPGDFNISVTSGIDWFDLDGKIQFDDQAAELPELLAAMRKGERFIQLGDGTLGMLPEKWLAKHAAFLEMGRAEDGHVRFAKTQIGLIDVLLAQMPEAKADAAVRAAREKIQKFAGIAACPEPKGFIGELRPYQREGLGWLGFLQEFRWGGCLADDMGLGKTIQVLALLVRRKRESRKGPCLVVAPKSLVFNWQREAARFAPELRVLDYTGLERKNMAGEIAASDLVLTTYGTLLRDIEQFSNEQFDYVFLDEAQAVKNPNAQSAKAVRLLKARHRLALTGTPVENHLGDLWSIFEFLNPGMLGGMEAFKAAFANGRGKDADPERLNMLSRMLRPFILRRTKAQVAPELPERNEQTIECELAPAQRAYYDELRAYYRASLLAKVEKDGLGRSKIQVLEALLRLRQAACHPALIDAKKKTSESAKLDSLIPMLAELTAEGHKALVFSQFVKFLDLLRARLDKLGMVYEYLDGKTIDRSRRVDRFQSEPDCPLFLVSLKAGGVGLNLTAADYVFILDPWWNPAVEAQAIDRTHRIGQTKKVMAYRLIARDTVEAKILELQKSKRALADAIITENNSIIKSLTREDLSLLLS